MACAALLVGPATAAEEAAPIGASAASGTAVKCIDDLGDSSANGAPVVIWACDGSAAQRWTVVDGTLRINGECFETEGQGTTDGTPVELGTCDGSSDQQWAVKSGALVSTLAGKCLADPDGAIADGTRLIISTCDGGADQDWKQSAPAAATDTAQAPAASAAWLPAALVALVAVGVGLFFGLPGASGRTGAISGAVRSLRPKRRRPVDPAVATLLADPTTVDDAVLAFVAAGRDSASWPYAVAVSTESATVWLAGFAVAEPVSPWVAVPGDSHAWTIRRSELPAADEGYQEFGTCPVVLGSLDDAVVVLDVSRSHGVLVIGGDLRLAEQVRSAIAEQLDGGEVVLREEGVDAVGGRPHWAVEVDSEGWITVHGRTVEFAQAPQLQTAPESTPVEVQGSAQAVETVSAARGSGSVAVSAVGVPRPAESADAVPAAEEAALADEPAEQSTQENATGWDNTAVSSAVPEPKPRKG